MVTIMAVVDYVLMRNVWADAVLLHRKLACVLMIKLSL